jgi:hypothetical protein
MTTDELKRKFLEDTLLPHALRDALQPDPRWSSPRPVFKPKPTEDVEKTEYEQNCKAFKDALRNELRELAGAYNSRVLDETHIQTIRQLSSRLTEGFKDKKILNGDTFLFGVAQKALNVYLKYLWCANLGTLPPHCPFDNGIIASLKPGPGIQNKWTFSSSEEDYKEWVRLAKEAATKKGYDPKDYDFLSKWEVREWDAQHGPPVRRKRGSKAGVALNGSTGEKSAA